jgi:hypothetical protein
VLERDTVLSLDLAVGGWHGVGVVGGRVSRSYADGESISVVFDLTDDNDGRLTSDRSCVAVDCNGDSVRSVVNVNSLDVSSN